MLRHYVSPFIDKMVIIFPYINNFYPLLTARNNILFYVNFIKIFITRLQITCCLGSLIEFATEKLEPDSKPVVTLKILPDYTGLFPNVCSKV